MSIKSILLIGNCVIDQIFTVSHYPAEDEELRAQSMTRVIGGNAANSAQILAQLGARVELMSSMARDPDAQWLAQQLAASNISTNLCQYHAQASTPQSTIWLNQTNGSRTIVHFRDLPELDLAQLESIDASAYRWIHFEGRNVETLLRYLPELRQQSVPVSLELEKHRSQLAELLPYLDTVIVSNDYLQQTELTAEACIHHFHQINSNLQIVCTLGSAGAIASDNSGDIIKIEAESVSAVVDTIGAGDCFIAGLINQLAGNNSFLSAVSYANRLAANKIQQQGMKVHV